jgi:hypothetical protein
LAPVLSFCGFGVGEAGADGETEGVTDGSAGAEGAADVTDGTAAGGAAVLSESPELQPVTSVNATAPVAAYVKIFRITAPRLLDVCDGKVSSTIDAPSGAASSGRMGGGDRESAAPVLDHVFRNV